MQVPLRHLHTGRHMDNLNPTYPTYPPTPTHVTVMWVDGWVMTYNKHTHSYCRTTSAWCCTSCRYLSAICTWANRRTTCFQYTPPPPLPPSPTTLQGSITNTPNYSGTTSVRCCTSCRYRSTICTLGNKHTTHLQQNPLKTNSFTLKELDFSKRVWSNKTSK